MEKTIKYLENGEYHYATVRDVGDLAKLKTDSKDDLVTAINELFITGGEAPKNPDGYDELVDNVADAIQKQQQMTDTITNMQQSAQLSDAEMEHMKQVQEELHQEYLKAIKELNEAVDKAKADAADLDKKTSDLQDKLDETFASVDKEVSDVHKQLDSESAGLRKDLDDTKTSLESTRKDLLNNTQEFGVVNSEVKELKDKMERRIWSTDLDPVREQVNKNTTEVSQTKDELKNKADQSSLDLVTNSVENLSTQVKENADGLKVSVKKDELGGDVARLLNDKTNLLLGTRSFSGEDNWKNRDTVTIEPGYYKGLKSAAVQVLDASIYQPYRVKANTAYTFSFFGKEDRDNPKATLVIKPIDAQNVNVDGGEQQVHITTEWQRFAVTFSVDQECEISIQIIQGPEATNNILHLAGLKLQYGQNDTPWEPNEADIAENIEHTESQFNVYSDQIAGIVKKQEKMGDTERQLDTRITETAEGLKQTSKDLQDANGKITEFKGQLESTARGLKTEYEKYTNEAIGQISDSSLNLIHNSAFSSQDNQFESWQNISAKATVREDSNNLHWVELTQSGQGTDNPIGVTSNYFIVKQGKVTVAVDIKLGDKATLDNQNILLLELYDESKKRVDFTDVSVSQLGLSMSVLNDHNVHRGLYRLGIDRKDVKYMTVKAILHRNGDLWLTNFSARLSSIDDGGYTPNPDDVNQQILKQNTKIEQNAKEVAIKANSVDVTRDIKSAVDGIQVGGVNLIPNSGTDIVIESKTTDAYPQWDNHLLYSSLQSNTTYTFSVSATNTNGVEQASVRIFKDSLDGKYLNKEAAHWYFNADGKRHNFTFTTPNDAIPYDIWLYAGPMGTLQGKNFVTTYHHPQLELGNKSTSWSPAPEDTSAEIKSAKDAAIQVASDQINLHVNELSTQFDDKLNKRVNEVKTASEKFTSDGIEQTVSKITEVKNNVDNLNKKVDSNNGGGINLQKGTKDFSFQIGTNGNPSSIETYNSDTKMLHIQNGGFYTSYSDSSFVPTPGEFYTFSADVKGDGTINGSGFRYEGGNNGTMGNVTLSGTWQRIINTVHVDKVQGQWVIYPANSKNLYVKHIKIERGTVATPWTAAPEDVESTHTLETANIDDMKSQGHYFVHNLAGNPIGGWVYVDVIGNNNDRVRQDVYADQNNQHKYRSWNGSRWSDWEQGAYLSDVNNVKTEVTASVKNLGDRVTTEVNSITSKVNEGHSNDVELIRNSNFEDGNKGNWTDDSTTIISGNTIPSELGQDGMKVLRSVRRDIYEDGILYSVKPNETFDVDYWVWPTGNYDSQLGLCFWDNAKKTIDWRGVTAKKGTGWTHYTGTIQAPAKAAFAKPWFQINKDGSESASAAWMAKPSIRRHDNFADQKISEINTKLDVANGQIQGKVTETQVQDLLNRGHYATQEWSQGQIKLTKDQFNVDIKKVTNDLNSRVNEVQTASEKFTSDGIEQVVTKVTNVKNDVDRLDQRVATNNGGGINLLRGTGSEWKTLTGSGWFCQTTGAGAVELGSFTTGDTVTYSITVRNNSQYAVRPEIVGFSDDNGTRSFNISGTESVQPGETKTVSVSATVAENIVKIIGWLISSGAEPTFSVDAKNEKLERGSIATPWSPNPQDAKTYTDSQIVNTNKKIDTQTLDSANIDQMKTQGHYFVKNLTGNPIGGWVYVDVTGNNNDRVRQDVYQDTGGKHMYRRLFGNSWSGWEQGAYISDVNNAKTEVTASVKNLGDRVTTEVNSITKMVNSINGGGVNLLRGTADFRPDNIWFPLELWTRTNEAYNGLTIFKDHEDNDWYGLTQYYSVKAGETYTFSLYARYESGSGSSTLLIMLNGDPENGHKAARVSPVTRDITLNEDWQRYSFTFTVNSDGYIKPRIERTSNNKNVLEICGFKLERGPVATPWTPAPEDTADQIKQLNTKWEVANGKIEGKVTETQVNDILNGKGYATQAWAQSQFRLKSDSIDLEVKKITDPIINKINSNNGGGVNLLKGTADFSGDWLYRDTEWDRASEKYNGLTVYKVHQVQDWCGLSQYYQVEAGQTYTFSAYARYSSGTGASNIFLGLNSDPENGHNNASMSPDSRQYSFDNNWKRVEITFTVSKSGYIKPRLERTNNNKNVLEVCGFKLERGSVATPWSPNPFDVDRKIGTQTLDNADINDMKTQGHYFVKNLTGNPIGGWVYVDVNCADQWRIRQDVYQDIGGSHVYRRLNGSSWTEWTTDVNNKNIISQINITPDQIKIASNKIVLDGDTEIKGTAFIPSAAIKDITADKITTGTLDVGKLNIKNLKADDIKTGTLSGITIRAGEEDGFFQTSEDNIYWITNSGGSAVIGKGKYVQYPGLNVFDNNAVYLGSWAGAELNKDGTINDYGGAMGNPKLAIETGGMRRRFNVDSWGGEFEDKPLDNNRIISWVGNKEFLSVERKNGTHIELNPDINDSQFTVQKDDKFGAYFGQGRDGNEINFTPIGGMTINGNFRVTGAKNAIVKTSQGTVAINAYETAGYFFGDIGSAKTSDNKVAMIDIESLFKETVNTDVEYQVFLTSYGPGDIWVSERQRDYFVVESELPNMEFGWEIKAKRKGYENTRLAKVDVSNVPTV